MNNGKMDRGNENPTQHLPWWLRKTTKNHQSGWSAPGFEPWISRMRVSCVTTDPPRSVRETLSCIISSGIWGPTRLAFENNLFHSYLRLKKPLKISTRLVGHGIWIRDLPKASLVRYHVATSLRVIIVFISNFSLQLNGIFFPVNLYPHCQIVWPKGKY